MKKIFTNNALLAGIAILLLVIGILFSYEFKTFQWLSRFGAIIVCMGILILARPSIAGLDIKDHIIMAETGLSHLNPTHYEKTNESVPGWVLEDIKSRTAVGWLGPLICFVGTVTNGFADLLNNVFFS